MPLRLSSLRFKAGPRPNGDATSVDPLGSILVLVGPNNSGKSAALREIRQWTHGGNAARVVLDAVDAEFPRSLEEALALLSPFRRASPPGGQIRQEGTEYFHIPVLQEADGPNYSGDRAYTVELLRSAVERPDVDSLRSWLFAPLTARLDGPTRFQLSSDQPLGDLQEPASNHLSALFRDDDARAELREMVYRAFERYPVLEAVGNGQIRSPLANELQRISKRNGD